MSGQTELSFKLTEAHSISSTLMRLALLARHTKIPREIHREIHRDALQFEKQNALSSGQLCFRLSDQPNDLRYSPLSGILTERSESVTARKERISTPECRVSHLSRLTK